MSILVQCSLTLPLSQLDCSFLKTVTLEPCLIFRFVSHCATQARRERYAKAMQKHMDVHIYGKCSRGKVKYECSRENEWDCYRMMEQV